jgi:hypothetical protein
MVPAATAEALPARGQAYPVGLGRTVSNSFSLMAVPVHEVRVGTLDLHAGTVAYPSPGARGNVGSLLLRDKVVKIDPAYRIVTLERATNPEDGCLT